MKRGFLIGIFFALIIFHAGFCFASVFYTITDLGHLGGARTNAYSINERGMVVGQSWIDTSYFSAIHAFFWKKGKMSDLGTLSGFTNSIATDINNWGLAVGVATAMGTAKNNTPVVWINNQIKRLSVSNGHAGEATAVNNFGIVAGHSCNTDVIPWVDRAVIWIYGNMMELPISTGSTLSRASGINDMGQIVGFEKVRTDVNEPEKYQAVLWQNGRLLNLGIPNSVAQDINNRGMIVGQFFARHNNVDHCFPFLYKKGHIIYLRLPDESQGSAESINNWGQIVGYTMDNNYDLYAVLWQNDNYYLLDDLIPDDSRWESLYWAHDINDKGQIVGEGIINGEVHGFLLSPCPHK